MGEPDLQSYLWLISSDARPCLDSASASDEPLPSLIRKLRRSLSPVQTHLVLEQVELRRRAAAKFSHADRMFFTRRSLEQATSERVAAWSARRFSQVFGAERERASMVLADLCCGVGGDLLALAQIGPVVGVDRDPIVAALARANAEALDRRTVCIRCADVREIALGDFAAWRLDPDRRTQRGRVSQPEFYEPDAEAMDRFLGHNPHGSIKLAPAARVPASWTHRAELEWISEAGECKQQVAWFGVLALRPGQRSATVLASNQEPRTVVGDANVAAPTATGLGRFLYEPDAAVLAAGLDADLAGEYGLDAVSPGVAYYTGDIAIDDAALSGFVIEEMLPFDRKRLKALLRERGVGRLELKKRGVEIDLERLRKELRVSGEQSGVILIAPIRGRTTAILARRFKPCRSRPPDGTYG